MIIIVSTKSALFHILQGFASRYASTIPNIIAETNEIENILMKLKILDVLGHYRESNRLAEARLILARFVTFLVMEGNCGKRTLPFQL